MHRHLCLGVWGLTNYKNQSMTERPHTSESNYLVGLNFILLTWRVNKVISKINN